MYVTEKLLVWELGLKNHFGKAIFIDSWAMPVKFEAFKMILLYLIASDKKQMETSSPSIYKDLHDLDNNFSNKFSLLDFWSKSYKTK